MRWCLVLVLAACGGKTDLRVPDRVQRTDAGRPSVPRDGGLDAYVAPRDSGPIGVDVGTDAGEVLRRPEVPCPDGSEPRVTRVSLDLLFIIDDSGSMYYEQVRLAEAFPAMLEILLDGDLDGDGEYDFQPLDELRVTIDTTDHGSRTASLCPVDPSPIPEPIHSLRLPATRAQRRAFESRVGLAARVGTTGCFMEQTFESLSSVERFDGDGRRGDVLSVIVLSDEDDCSVEDVRIFHFDSPRYPHDPERDPAGELRCFLYPEALVPVESYVTELRGRRSDPRDVLFSALTGVPVGLSDPARILADPRMDEVVDDANPWRLRPVCEGGDDTAAAPARRIVEVARRLGPQGSVQSICSGDIAPLLENVARRIAERLEERRCPAEG